MILPLHQGESARLYWELGRRGAPSTGEKRRWKYGNLSEEELLTLAVLQTRYDPRLMAILVDLFRTPQTNLHPIQFKERLREVEALPIVAVLGEFVLEAAVPVQVKEFFRFLTSGVRPVPTQLFYRGIYPLGSKKMEEAAIKPLWGFKKWGFLAADPPLLKEDAGHPYLYDATSRFQILRELTSQKPRFRLRDYQAAVRFSISRQQALKDLRSLPWIKKSGLGKGTLWKCQRL